MKEDPKPDRDAADVVSDSPGTDQEASADEPFRVKPGEDAQAFIKRASAAFARAGHAFDFMIWLRRDATASINEMTHPSWTAYMGIIKEYKEAQDHAIDTEA